MKILLTGGSSFTGYWFIRELAAADHDITATFTREPAEYEGIRRERVERAVALCQPVYGCSFGDDRFHGLIESGRGWDLLCHHAARVADYKSPDFDVAQAVRENTMGLRRTLSLLKAKGCRAVVLTGSVFEQGEGAGSDDLRAFSPYGLSKGLTAEVFKYYTREAGLPLGKFVIPNPFGPYEEPRFTTYLIDTWYAGKVAEVSTPDYVRDNIHVSLLAKCYGAFASELTGLELTGLIEGFSRCGPMGYAESQGAFARRFASKMRTRLGLPCELKFAVQTEFPEPAVRTNADLPDIARLGWNEEEAWQELAEYYRQRYSVAPVPRVT
jgi:nucleoside-diphosphate-sugar epimerase